jgi:hypothetical protein
VVLAAAASVGSIVFGALGGCGAPTSLKGNETYFGADVVKGLGPHVAKRRIKTFGEAIFEVIEPSPVEGRGAHAAPLNPLLT